MENEHQLTPGPASQEVPKCEKDEDNNNPNDDKMVGDVYRPRRSSLAASETSSGVRYPQEQDESYTCCCFWKPLWAQRLLSPVFFLVCVCLVVFGDAVSLGAFTGITTSIETRYRLSASNLGVLVTMYSAGNMVALPFVSYFGGRRGTNRPRWIASGVVLIALGTFLNALPQFVFGKYDAVPSSGQVDTLVCTAANSTDWCNSYYAVGAQNDAAFWIMVAGSVISGAGYAAIPTLSLSYIDDNCKTETTAVYVGIIQSMYGVGTMIGFFISSYSLTFWVDFYRLDPDTTIPSPDHPAWVGAWWLGLLVCSVFFGLSCLPLFGFPKQLPKRYSWGSDAKSRERKSRRRARLSEEGDCEDVDSEAEQKAQELPGKETTDQNLDSGTKEGLVKGLLKTYFRLMRNPVLMCITLGTACQAIVEYGFATFFNKYLESQFEVTASFADLLTGVALLPPYGIGYILGGYIVRKTRMGYPNMFLFAMAALVVGLASFIPNFFLGCSNPQIAGVTVGYEGQSLTEISLLADCNANCSCTASTYRPVCDAVGDVIYFSPCFAGCNGTSDNVLYNNCSCLASSTDTALAGLCEFHCGTLVPFLVMQVFQTIAITMAGAPQMILVLKCVDLADKTAAVGFNRFFTGLGALVGPMLYALFVDQSCLVWQSECGEYGSCQIYDIERYRNLIMAVTLITGVVGVAGTCPAYFFIRRTNRKQAESSQLQGIDSPISMSDMEKVDDTED
ncbi:solute carrier organic anion transporter family member 1A4-like [Patiria miniata]|uniref:Solute carrier organic anion transporter family member n=1 Tax=Patiria miniata TaxID=46514 RepID=A0A914ARI8_PATMI|nr:solute carrier organic anion transporter family member 1A4-like [Patiria miniata]